MKRVGGHSSAWRHPALVVAAALLALGGGVALTQAPLSSSSEGAQSATKGQKGEQLAAADREVKRAGPNAGPAARRMPNGDAKEGNSIRLLAGSFDPLSDSLPAPRGIPLRSEITLAPDQPQYWLAQVRDRRFPDAIRAVKAVGGMVA